MTSPPPTPERRALAGEMLAARFNRTMNACTSPRGFLCDLSMAALFSALPLVLIVAIATFVARTINHDFRQGVMTAMALSLK